MSNNPAQWIKSNDSLYPIDGGDVFLLAQPPFREDFYHIGVETTWIQYPKADVTDWMGIRRDCLNVGDYEYYYIVDDDIIFTKESPAFIEKALQYMDDNPLCGALYFCGTVGGMCTEQKVIRIEGGHLNTNRGILIRGGHAPFHDKFHFTGACDDWALGLTKIMQGFYIARYFMAPMDVRQPTQLGRGSGTLTYDMEFIESERGFLGNCMRILSSPV